MGSEEREVGVAFLKAGPAEDFTSVSVSPLEEVVDDEEDIGEETLPEYLKGEELDRIGLDREDEFIRRLVDPKLPTQAEVDLHNLRGHVEYRNWCGICVRCLSLIHI